MPDPIKPTQADREAAASSLRRIGRGLFYEHLDVLTEAFALHAQQAREQALEEAVAIAEEYKNRSVGDEIAAIRALKEPHHEA